LAAAAHLGTTLSAAEGHRPQSPSSPDDVRTCRRSCAPRSRPWARGPAD